MEATQPLNHHHILQALNAICTQGANAAQIKIANDFLARSEHHPFFSTTLLAIYSNASTRELQMSSLLLLTNVIKRNWRARRGTPNVIPPPVKQQLRRNILQAYFLHEVRNYKHFNQLIGYLTKIDYPAQYADLHQFIINSLTQLIQVLNTDLQALLKNNQVLVVLSTCKTILKEYSLKKISHNEETFVGYIAPIIQLSLTLSQQLFLKIKQHGPIIQLFEYLRKIDKVVLYGLRGMPISYQYKPEIKAIVRSYAQRITEFNSVMDSLATSEDKVSLQAEKYLIGVLQQLGRLQNYFPFAFSDFLKEYLLLIIDMLINKVPKSKYYKTEKMLSTVIIANFKPFISFAYYQTPEEFLASVYSKNTPEFQNISTQRQCHNVFREVYSPQTIPQLIEAVVAQVMTANHVLQGEKGLTDEIVLEDYEANTPTTENSQTTPYQHCITLLKTMIKCFQNESLPTVKAMIAKVQDLKTRNNRYTQQIVANILEIVLVLPHVYNAALLPVDQVCQAIKAVYQASRFGYLARIIRKYHMHLPPPTFKDCFQILARVVATPVNGAITAEIIYHSALGLKTLLKQMQGENVPIQLLGACIANIVSLVRMKQFTASPTLLWPIINLLIIMVKCIYDLSKEVVNEAVSITIQGLSQIISSDRNDELIVCALAELLSTLLGCSFKPIKEEYPIRGRVTQLSQKIQKINPASFIVFQACLVFLRGNVNNRALQNYDTVYRLWLTLMRTYPTVHQQQLYGFHLSDMNSKLIQFFKCQSRELMEEDYVLFVQILEEYFITELVQLEERELVDILAKRDDDEDEKKLRVIMATASLYYSFSLLKHPVMEIFQTIFQELLQLQARISPQINSVRTLLFLIMGQHMLHHSAGELYSFFSKSVGNLGWFLTFLSNMTYVTNKFAFKLNAACLIKAISDIGAGSYSTLLVNSVNGQFPIDQFMRVVTIELGQVNLDFMVNSYHNIFRNLMPNQIADKYDVTVFRKTRLHLSDPLLIRIAQTDLVNDFRANFGEVLRVLDWTSEDLQERVGEKAALQLCGYLGWQRKIV